MWSSLGSALQSEDRHHVVGGKIKYQQQRGVQSLGLIFSTTTQIHVCIHTYTHTDTGPMGINEDIHGQAKTPMAINGTIVFKSDLGNSVVMNSVRNNVTVRLRTISLSPYVMAIYGCQWIPGQVKNYLWVCCKGAPSRRCAHLNK